MRIFIGTPTSPAAGRWYDLDDASDKELALAKAGELDEYLISDVEIIHDTKAVVSLQSEHPIDTYVELQDKLEEYDEWDLAKALCIIDDQGRYVYDPDQLDTAVENSTLYSDWDDAVEQFVELLLCDIRDERLRNRIETYLDDERIKRDLSYSGFSENGGGYVLETY